MLGKKYIVFIAACCGNYEISNALTAANKARRKLIIESFHKSSLNDLNRPVWKGLISPQAFNISFCFYFDWIMARKSILFAQAIEYANNKDILNALLKCAIFVIWDL